MSKHISQRNAEGKGSTGKNLTLKRAGEPAKLGADLDRASRAECLASEMQGERDKVKQGIKYAALFHEHQGELDDIGSLKERTQGQSYFQRRKKLQGGSMMQQVNKKDQHMCAKGVGTLTKNT